MEAIDILVQFSAIVLLAIFTFDVIVPSIVDSFRRNVISGIIAMSWWMVIIWVGFRIKGFISSIL